MKERYTGKRTLLLIEDDEINRQILKEILEETYFVIATANGQEGLDILQKYGQGISAIMLDIQMPVMDGYEFLERISQDEVYSQIPVIVTTVLDSVNDEKRCLELGAADFIVKPYNPVIVKMRVENIIRLRECSCIISELELDALTGFKTRKAYYNDIEAIESDEVKSAQPVGVVFTDINGLKSINDRSGHEAGDKLIISIARDIAEAFPDANRYRLGGDEFVVLSFDKSEEAFTEKIRKLETQWQEGYSAAVGSIWLESARKLEKNVALADKQMYRDKSRYYENKVHDRRRNRCIDSDNMLRQVQNVGELLPGGFFVYHMDANEELITFNTELVKIFGCQNAEEFRKLTGNTFRGMVHPDDYAGVEDRISEQIQQEKDIDLVSYRITCKDGTEKQVFDYGRFVHTEMYGDVYYVFMSEITGE